MVAGEGGVGSRQSTLKSAPEALSVAGAEGGPRGGGVVPRVAAGGRGGGCGGSAAALDRAATAGGGPGASPLGSLHT